MELYKKFAKMYTARACYKTEKEWFLIDSGMLWRMSRYGMFTRQLVWNVTVKLGVSVYKSHLYFHFSLLALGTLHSCQYVTDDSTCLIYWPCKHQTCVLRPHDLVCMEHIRFRTCTKRIIKWSVYLDHTFEESMCISCLRRVDWKCIGRTTKWTNWYCNHI